MLTNIQHKITYFGFQIFRHCGFFRLDVKKLRSGAVVKAACLQSQRSRVSSLALTFNFELSVQRAMSSHSSHYSHVLLTQFSLYMSKCSLNPNSFSFTVRLACLIVCPSIRRFARSIVRSFIRWFNNFFHAISVCSFIS